MQLVNGGGKARQSVKGSNVSKETRWFGIAKRIVVMGKNRKRKDESL